MSNVMSNAMSNVRWIVRATALVLLALPFGNAGQSQADATTTSYEVGGIRVIHRRASNEIVAANLYLLGGSRQVTFENAGIEPLILAASERGSARFTRDQLRSVQARTGANVVVNPERDWTLYGLRTTVAAFRESWAAFADRLVAPTLDDAGVAAERYQLISALGQLADSPDGWAEHLADSVAFQGHPYGIDPRGTIASVTALNAAALREYHRTQFVRSRILLVVVGNLERALVDSAITATLARLPAGSYRWTLPDTIPRRPSTVHRVSRPLPTNYLVGYAPGPRADDPDFEALRVASAILSGRLFAEVRSRQSLTYAVSAPFVERAVGAVGLYVSTTDPLAAVNAMRAEIGNLQDYRVDAGALTQLIQQFITEYFLSNETNAAQANFLARAQLYEGDWRRGNAFRNSLRSVTPDDVQRVMRRWYRDINFAYVGDPARLPIAAVRGF